MEIIEYQTYCEEEILPLYASVGWTAYTDAPDVLHRGFERSLLTLAAYLTVSGRLDEVRIGQAVWACACLSAFGGAMMTLRGKRGVAALPLLATAAFWACVSLLGLLASDAPDLNGVLGLLAASALGGLLAAGLARREKGKRTKRHKTPRSRR